jgi:hypothetical protein
MRYRHEQAPVVAFPPSNSTIPLTTRECGSVSQVCASLTAASDQSSFAVRRALCYSLAAPAAPRVGDSSEAFLPLKVPEYSSRDQVPVTVKSAAT